ncbi:MAG TPA: hypothetical protein RMF84_09010, partial [Polyangiaceae bacterium LLY-WYZ-14_1]|nr:hypothetical protein [Polyangiaceae bacterium LLY-WYZ-14_1]
MERQAPERRRTRRRCRRPGRQLAFASAAAVLFVLPGCYLSFRLEDEPPPPDGGTPDAPSAVVDADVVVRCGGLEIPVAADGLTPSLALPSPGGGIQGGELAMAWVDDCVQQVFWIENRGIDGLLVAGAVLTGGQVTRGPFLLIAPDAPRRVRPETIEAARLGDEVAVYWTAGDASRPPGESYLLFSQRVSLDGELRGERVELPFRSSQRVPLKAFDDGAGGHRLVVAGARGAPVAVTIPEDAPPTVTPLSEGPIDWIYAVAQDTPDVFRVIWATRTANPGENDLLITWTARLSDEAVGPRLIIRRAENVLLSFFGRPAVVAQGNLWIGVSELDGQSVLVSPREGDAPRQVTGLRQGRPVLAAGRDEVLVLVGAFDDPALDLSAFDATTGDPRRSPIDVNDAPGLGQTVRYDVRGD